MSRDFPPRFQRDSNARNRRSRARAGARSRSRTRPYRICVRGCRTYVVPNDANFAAATLRQDVMPPKAFEAIFTELVKAFQPRNVTRDTCASYWVALGSKYRLPALREAAHTLTRSQRFFPNPSEWATAAQAANSRTNRRPL